MTAGSAIASSVRHIIGVGLQALLIGAIVVVLAFGVALASGHPAGASSVFAAKGGNGQGGGNQSNSLAGGCVANENVVSGYGLPTDEVINFFVTDVSGTRGWVLGFSGDGTWSEPVPAHASFTTYEFASRTWGPNGTHYNVFASCSAE